MKQAIFNGFIILGMIFLAYQIGISEGMKRYKLSIVTVDPEEISRIDKTILMNDTLLNFLDVTYKNILDECEQDVSFWRGSSNQFRDRLDKESD